MLRYMGAIDDSTPVVTTGMCTFCSAIHFCNLITCTVDIFRWSLLLFMLHFNRPNNLSNIVFIMLFATCEICFSAWLSTSRWYSSWKAVDPWCSCRYHMHSNSGYLYQHVDSKASRLVDFYNSLHVIFIFLDNCP